MRFDGVSRAAEIIGCHKSNLHNHLTGRNYSPALAQRLEQAGIKIVIYDSEEEAKR
jgi:hypothetical protein